MKIYWNNNNLQYENNVFCAQYVKRGVQIYGVPSPPVTVQDIVPPSLQKEWTHSGQPSW